MDPDAFTKTVLKEGSGSFPQEGREVSVHFVGKYLENDKEVIFNSSRETNEPLRFTIGRDHTIPALEKAVISMKEGELARILIRPEGAFGPMGNPHGFHGSGKAIPPNTQLILDTELLTIDDSVGSDQPFGDPLEKFEAAKKRKEEGNQMFKEKKYPGANAKWSAAVGFLEGIKSGPPHPAMNMDDVDALLIALYNNLAHISILNNDYNNALRHSKAVLRLDEDNTKGLFRRGKARKELGHYEEAMDDFKKCLELTKKAGGGGGTVKNIHKEMQELKPLIKKVNEKSDKFWKGTFDKIQEEELYTKEDIKEIMEDDKRSRMRKCHICGEEVEDIQLARHVIKKHSNDQKKK